MTTLTTKITWEARGIELDPAHVTASSEFNSRKKINGIEDLAESILALGQTTPVGVVQNGDAYDLVYGFRRFNAIQHLIEAGHDIKLLADVVSTENLNDLVLLNVQENVSREQLTLTEEYEAVAKLTAFMTRDQIMETLGVTKTWITQRLKIGELSDILREAVDDGLSVRAAQTLQLLPEELHEEYASRAVGQSVSTVADMVQSRINEREGLDPEPTDDDSDIELLDDDEDLQPLEEDDLPTDEDDDDGAPNPLEAYITSLVDAVEDEDEDRKEKMQILIASIRWKSVADGDKILKGLQYCFEEDDESDS
jgi:ParB/RepB/Spo0J family partition protein